MTEHLEGEKKRETHEYNVSELSQRQQADLWRLEEPKGFHIIYSLDMF